LRTIVLHWRKKLVSEEPSKHAFFNLELLTSINLIPLLRTVLADTSGWDYRVETSNRSRSVNFKKRHRGIETITRSREDFGYTMLRPNS